MNFKKAERAMAPVPKQLEEQAVQTMKIKSAQFQLPEDTMVDKSMDNIPIKQSGSPNLTKQ